MLTALKNWQGSVDINGVSYANIAAACSGFTQTNGPIHIVLHPMQNNRETAGGRSVVSSNAQQEYRITVKQYMTRKSTPEFDFMEKWNKDVPMPLRVMTGVKVKETRGMVYMKLHGDIYAEKICTCMKCGRALTNPVSQYFGIGPECGNHGYVNPFDTEEQLRDAVSSYRKELQNITWEGWIIKSAITEEVEI